MQILTLKNSHVVNVDCVAQINLWNHVQNLINFTKITPIYYEGGVAGIEFLTYAATKLYVCLEMEVSFTAGQTLMAFQTQLGLYDETDTLSGVRKNNVPIWDVTGAAMNVYSNSVSFKNVYFSRVNIFNYEYIKFNGFRLT